MFLVELVMQGVRGFREPARLRFQRGFNFIAGGNESGKTTAVDSIQHLLYPNNQAGHLEELVSRFSPDASRGALVVCSDDGTYYRIIQDFSKRAVNLSKYNTASKEFGLLHKDWDSAVQFMNGLTSGITEADYARIFVLRRDDFGRRSHVAVPSASIAAPRGAADRPGRPATATASPNQEKIVALRETMRKAEEAADADYKYQSAKLAQDEIKKKLITLETLEQKKSEIDSTLEALKGCETLPGNLQELLEDQERRQSQKMLEIEERDKQIEGLKMQLASTPPSNLMTDKLFIAGVVLAILSFVAGLSILTEELAYLFPIGLLLAFGLMGGAWYNVSRKSAQGKKIVREVEELEKERGEIEKRFEQEGAAVAACMRATGASSSGELKEKSENYRYFLSLRSDHEEQRQRMLGDQSLEILRQQYQQQGQQVVELEKAARAVAQYAIDTYSIRQDIERLESEMSAASGNVSWDPGSDVQEMPSPFSEPEPGPGGFLTELGIAGRIGGIEMETLIPAVEAAAQRNLAAVTGGKYIRIEAGHDGDPIVHTKDDAVVNYSELSHGTKSLIYFCLRTGLVEAIAGKRRLPFVLDDPLAEFDPARQKAACQVLRALGTKTQMVLFTSNPALSAEGDAVAELK